MDILRLESARRAVLLRSEGHCESPGCTGEAQDITDAGRSILDVDHIQDFAQGGPDHPEQMIALCPNCHAIKSPRPHPGCPVTDISARFASSDLHGPF